MRWPRRREVYGERRAGRVVVATTARRAAKQGVLWGLVFGATIAASATSYVGLFPTEASRVTMAATFQGNAAWAALFGPLRRLDTVAGYTAYKSGMTVVILGAIWGLLIATDRCAARRTPAGGSCSCPGTPPAAERPRRRRSGWASGSSPSGCRRRC